MTLHTAIPYESNTVVLMDEIAAASRSWDAMADAALDFDTDRYERAKTRFAAEAWRLREGEKRCAG